MKKLIILLTIGMFMLACNKEDDNTTNNGSSPSNPTKGQVTFAANFEEANCPTETSVYINDTTLLGIITISHDTVIECGIEGNLTKELDPGIYDFKIQIIADIPHGTQEVTFDQSINILAGECKKMYLNCSQFF